LISVFVNEIGPINNPDGFLPLDYKNVKELWAMISVHTYSPIIFQDEYRLGDNFMYSDLCVMDVDNKHEPFYTLEHVVKDFGDCSIVVGGTRNHMLPKAHHDGIAPRFRILIPWEERITCPHTYEKSMKFAQSLCEGADLSTKDIARQFYPCKEFLLALGPGEKMPVIPATPAEIEAKRKSDQYKREASVVRPLPGHIVEFLKSGKVFGGSRNNSVYTSARSLVEKGFTNAEIEELVRNAPFDRRGFRDAEIKSCINSARKKTES
jgi:hypothetical protein